MRVFVAIDLPQINKDELGLLEINHPNFFRYPTHNLHLTLKFIGEITLDKLKQVKERLKTIEFPLFKITFSTISYFHPHRRGTPIWIGVEDNIQLMELQEKVDQTLQTLELKLDKMKYTPHLTLGRMDREIKEVEIMQFIKTIQVRNMSITVKEFTLFHSHSIENGIEYLPLESFQAKDCP